MMTLTRAAVPPPTTTVRDRSKVLCVDDEPQILEGLLLHLRRHYDVTVATSGAAGLEALSRELAMSVVISDMRMPVMDGATFLSRARQLAPDAVRLLLTGHASLESSIAAVNDGQIFRFLTKPCRPESLLAAVDAADARHRVVVAERGVLEQTLSGSVNALMDVLALASPASFGRANRVKQRISSLVDVLGLPGRWQVEVAAMLSGLGGVSLPPATAEKLYYGQPLTEDEQQMLACVPAVTEQLLRGIPRLEMVRKIIAAASTPYGHRSCGHAIVARAAQLIRVATDFDVLESQGHSHAFAMAALCGRSEQYDTEVLDVFGALYGERAPLREIRAIPLLHAQTGMVLAEDVTLASGALLVARGYVVTAAFVERVRSFHEVLSRQTVRIMMPALEGEEAE